MASSCKCCRSSSSSSSSHHMHPTHHPHKSQQQPTLRCNRFSSCKQLTLVAVIMLLAVFILPSHFTKADETFTEASEIFNTELAEAATVQPAVNLEKIDELITNDKQSGLNIINEEKYEIKVENEENLNEQQKQAVNEKPNEQQHSIYDEVNNTNLTLTVSQVNEEQAETHVINVEQAKSESDDVVNIPAVVEDVEQENKLNQSVVEETHSEQETETNHPVVVETHNEQESNVKQPVVETIHNGQEEQASHPVAEETHNDIFTIVDEIPEIRKSPDFKDSQVGTEVHTAESTENLELAIRNSVKTEIEMEQNLESSPVLEILKDIPEPEIRQKLTEDIMSIDQQTLEENDMIPKQAEKQKENIGNENDKSELRVPAEKPELVPEVREDIIEEFVSKVEATNTETGNTREARNLASQETEKESKSSSSESNSGSEETAEVKSDAAHANVIGTEDENSSNSSDEKETEEIDENAEKKEKDDESSSSDVTQEVKSSESKPDQAIAETSKELQSNNNINAADLNEETNVKEGEDEEEALSVVLDETNVTSTSLEEQVASSNSNEQESAIQILAEDEESETTEVPDDTEHVVIKKVLDLKEIFDDAASVNGKLSVANTDETKAEEAVAPVEEAEDSPQMEEEQQSTIDEKNAEHRISKAIEITEAETTVKQLLDEETAKESQELKEVSEHNDVNIVNENQNKASDIDFENSKESVALGERQIVEQPALKEVAIELQHHVVQEPSSEDINEDVDLKEEATVVEEKETTEVVSTNENQEEVEPVIAAADKQEEAEVNENVKVQNEILEEQSHISAEEDETPEQQSPHVEKTESKSHVSTTEAVASNANQEANEELVSPTAANDFHFISTTENDLTFETELKPVLENHDIVDEIPVEHVDVTKTVKGSRSVNKAIMTSSYEDSAAATLFEAYLPHDAGQTLNGNLADESSGIGKALPVSITDGSNRSTFIIVLSSGIACLFIVISVTIFMISFQRQHGTLDIEMQERSCGKDNLDEEDAETFAKLLEVELPPTVSIVMEEAEECL